MTSRLRELDGLLRQGGVTITPAAPPGSEQVMIPYGDPADGTLERFNVTTTTQRVVTGTVLVYNTRTGEPRPVDINSLPSEMRKKHRDRDFPAFFNKDMYTLDKDSVPVHVIGTLLCPLNPKHPDFLTYQGLGAQPCRKHTLPHDLAVENHVRIKHQLTWRNMERKHALALEEEERQYRRFQMGLDPFTGERRVTLGPVISWSPEVEVREKLTVVKTCEVCGEEFSGAIAMAAAAKLKSHVKRVHASEPA